MADHEGWICPRCGIVWAPSITSCSCPLGDTKWMLPETMTRVEQYRETLQRIAEYPLDDPLAASAMCQWAAEALAP